MISIARMGTNSSKLKTKANKHPHSSTSQLQGIRPSCPGKPTLKSGVNICDPDVIVIQWDPPQFDGGARITGYVVEHRRIGSPYWLKATPVKVYHTTLSLSGLEPGWRYHFRVFAENVHGFSEPSPVSEPLAISTHRIVAIAPYFVEGLHDVSSLENQEVELEVKFQGVPSPRIAWYKDGIELYSSRCLKISTTENTSVLLIHQVSLTDEGEVKCTATNRAGHAITRANLLVRAPPTIRLPRQYERGLFFENGEDIRLKVTVIGQPTPSVTWFHNDEQILMDVRHEITYGDRESVLKIKNAQRIDNGEYQVHAVNSIGEEAVSVFVTVAHKPLPPSKPQIERVLGRSVTLSWRDAENDGSCNVKSYIVEYYKIGLNCWLKVMPCRQRNAVLDNLLGGARYKFRVRAENPYGISEPSPESDTVFIQDHPGRRIHSASDLRGENESIINMNEIYQRSPSVVNNFEVNGVIGHLLEYEKPDQFVPQKPKRRRATDRNSKTPDRNVRTPDRSVKSPDKGTRISDKIMTALEGLGSSSDASMRAKLTEDSQILPLPKPVVDESREDSELMLVLLPDRPSETESAESTMQNTENSEKSNNLSPPPPPLISLSAPELGDTNFAFELLQRNCISSTELLHESTIARVYKDLLLEDENQEPRTIKHNSSKSEADVPVVVASKMKKQFKFPFSLRNEDKFKNSLETRMGNDINVRKNPQKIFGANGGRISKELMLPRIKKIGPYSGSLQRAHFSEDFNIHREDLSAPDYGTNSLDQENVASSSRYTLHHTRAHRGGILRNRLQESNLDQDKYYEDRYIVDNLRNKRYRSLEREFFGSRDSESDISRAESSFASNSTSQNWRHEEGQYNICYTRRGFSAERENTFEYESDVGDYSGTSEDDKYDKDENETAETLSFEKAVEISYGNKFKRRSPTKETFLEDDIYKEQFDLNDSYAVNDRTDKCSKNVTDHNTLISGASMKPGSGHSDVNNKVTQNTDVNQRNPLQKVLKPILKRPSQESDIICVNRTGAASYGSEYGSVDGFGNLDSRRYSSSSGQKKQVRIEEPECRNRVTNRLNEHHGTPRVMVDHYSDIVKEYGTVQKSPTKVYLTFEELQKAARTNDENEDGLFNSNQISRRETPERSVNYKQEKDMPILCSKRSFEGVDYDFRKQVTSRSDISKVINKVHFIFDFSFDVIMFILACWLYFFKDVKLAIPVLALMLYRQLYEKLKLHISSWKHWWKRGKDL